MAIDFLILTVLLLSFFINLLALAAFWVTPGLRTTANRFTINLLVINLVGCLILAPTLFLTSDSFVSTLSTYNLTNTETTSASSAATLENYLESSLQLTHDDSIEFYSKSGNQQMTIRHNGEIVERDGIILQHESNANSHEYDGINPNGNTNPNNNDNENENDNFTKNKESDNKSNNTTMHTIETIYKCNVTYCRQLTIDENGETLIIKEIEKNNSHNDNNDDGHQNIDENRHQSQHSQHQHHHQHTTHYSHHTHATSTAKQMYSSLNINMRPWCIDMAAALSAMAVLLIVGDTWCAVTDPLRYQSRISGLKTWTLIALTWAIGLFFGALSAFRDFNFDFDTDYASGDAMLSKQKRYALENHTFYTLSSANNIFSVIFASLYFLIIILLPFGIVCGMYWRIFSEARGNGLRMRQNGSSPLLQSSLNLHQGLGQSNIQQYANSLCAHRNSISSNSSQGGGGAGGSGSGVCGLQIDQTKRLSPACLRRDSAAKVLLPPITDDGLSDENDVDSTDNIKLQQHSDHQQHQEQQRQLNQQNQQHIILTLQTASGEIKRNYSVRQLEVLMATSQDFVAQSHLTTGMRQVHSTPNLQRTINLPHSEDEMYSAHLLGGQLSGISITGRHQPTFQSNRLTHSNYQGHFNHPHNHQLQQHHQHHHLHHHHHSMPTTRQSSLQIPAIQASPKTLSYMSSLRHRLSNASSLFKYREESRAARISILVVIMFLVSYLPYGFLVLLQSRIPSANFKHSSQLAIFMILLANLSSPFIFAYRNKRVRKGVQRLLHCDLQRKNSSRHQNHYHHHHYIQQQQQRHQKQQLEQQQQQSQSQSSHHEYKNGNVNCCASLQRNSSRASNYSNHSGRYLTPQSSVASNNSTAMTFNYVITNNNTNNNNNNNTNNNNNKMGNLKKDLSCSTIINLTLNKNSHSLMDTRRTTSEDDEEENVINVQQQQQQQQQQEQQQQQPSEQQLSALTMSATTTTTTTSINQQQQQQQQRTRPVLQRGITIVEQMPLNNEENPVEIVRPPVIYKFFSWLVNNNNNNNNSNSNNSSPSSSSSNSNSNNTNNNNNINNNNNTRNKVMSTQVRSDHHHHQQQHDHHYAINVEPADV